MRRLTKWRRMGNKVDGVSMAWMAAAREVWKLQQGRKHTTLGRECRVRQSEGGDFKYGG